MKRLCLLIILVLVAMVMAQMGKEMKNLEHAKVNYWRKTADGKDYFRQTNIDLKNYDKGIIRAKVLGRWQNFTIRELPKEFMEWNIRRRLKMLERVRKNEMPELAGPHSGIVASHGLRRFDSQFTINNAVKGMGFLPKPEKLEELLNLLITTRDSSIEYKIGVLESLYKNNQAVFDRTKQVSLELYATPEFETHTFLNQMTDPGVCIVFLDFPSYELRAITQLLHPNDPKLNRYEQNVVRYINAVHDYFHGESPRQSIGVIYHIIEVFDNTPSKGRGKRIVPTLP